MNEDFPTEYDIHPVADLFPMVTGAEYEEILTDIKTRGLDQPVVFWRDASGRIFLVDGRNRIKMCGEVDLVPKHTFLAPEADPVAYIISANLHRRHLTTGKRAELALKYCTAERGDNRHTLDRPKGPSTSEQPSTSTPTPKVSQKEAGEKMDVSPTEMKKLKWLQKRAPDLAKKVTGTEGMKIGTAMAEAEKRGLKSPAPQTNRAQSQSNSSRRSSKSVPKSAENNLQHHGDGSVQTSVSKLTAKLNPIFDKLWQHSADARTYASQIEKALHSSGLVIANERIGKPEAYLKRLKENAPKAKTPTLAAAWDLLIEAWNAATGKEHTAFVEARYKASDDELLRLLNQECMKLAEIDVGILPAPAEVAEVAA